ncbi:MAG: proton-conducting transporter membrane subunit [Candidatus Margulisiibacteriota bacterium]
MTNQLPFLVVGIPLFTALFIGIFGLFNKSLIRPIGIVGILLSTLSAIQLFLTVTKSNVPVEYFFGNWKAPIGIAYSIDNLNALMILMIYVVSFLAFIYSLNSVKLEISTNKHVHYYTLYFLLITGLVGITITGDAFNLYVLFEICALSGYALLAIGGKRAYLPTFYYLLIGSIGACFYLIGVAYLFVKTGTLNMAHLFELLPVIYFSKSILIGFIFVNIGLFIKMALFPVHGWMPNVYSKAPVSTTCLMAPLGTKLSIYILMRFYFDVFSTEYVYQVLNIQYILVWLATFAIIAGSLYAIYHQTYRKIITFIIVAEVGYIVGGLWIGNQDSVLGAIYHIVADSLMTLALFMISGLILFLIKKDRVEDFKQVFSKLPMTTIGLIVVFASIVGIPPTAGFFSKFYLIKGAFLNGYYHFIVALLLSSLTSLFIFFRFFESYFYNKENSDEQLQIKEPLLMTIPLICVAVLVLGFGLSFEFWHDYILEIIPMGLR